MSGKMKQHPSRSVGEHTDKATTAILLLLLQHLPDSEKDGGKRELLLRTAGFTHDEIAALLGKTRAAVAKSTSRATDDAKEQSEVSNPGGAGEEGSNDEDGEVHPG